MTIDMLTHNNIELIAQITHEANRAYCQSIGDDTQPPWETAPDWQKDSARLGVKMALNEATQPSDSHASWLKQKVDDGWQYGPIKDPANKLHPCIVPYDQLPASQRRKDYLFLATARAAASALMVTL
jgi:hypothetical protein